MAKTISTISFVAYGEEYGVTVSFRYTKLSVSFDPRRSTKYESQIAILRQMNLKDEERVIRDFEAVARMVLSRYNDR
jgi:predicted ThiF/HesA family dinucleotide-utilizing enzyme